MGFKVIKDVDVYGVGELTEFYVRIDKYTVYKNRSCIDLLAGHLTSPEAATSASGVYFGDFQDYDGYIPTSMSFDGNQVNYNPRLSFDLQTPEDGHEPYMSASVERQVTEYVDFDDNGNEILQQDVNYITTKTESTVKHRKDLNVLTGSIYEFAYAKLKEKYLADFDPCTIEDVL